MYKNIVIISLFIFLLPLKLFAYDKNGQIYLQFNAGYMAHMLDKMEITQVDLITNNTKTGFDNGYSFGAALGYNITNDIRAEFEINYRAFNVEKPVNIGALQIGGGELTIQSLDFMTNLIYDFAFSAQINPYIGIGFGYMVSLDNEILSNINYQALIGLSYLVDEEATFYAGYKYLGTFDFSKIMRSSDNSASLLVNNKIGSHIIEMGYRHHF